MTTHKLKIYPEYFRAVIDPDPLYRKTVEIRKNDRNYQVGDVILLQEYDPSSGYTGRKTRKVITHILCEPPYVPNGYAALSITEDPKNDEMLNDYRSTLEKFKQMPPNPELQSMIQDLEIVCRCLEKYFQNS